MGQRQSLYLLFPALCIILAAAVVGYTRPAVLERLERLAFDAHYTSIPTPQEQRRIAVVLAGEPTFGELGTWPWSRATHARLLGRLGMAEAVLLDIVMPESGTAEGDDLLAAVVRTMGNVVAACHLAVDNDGRERVIYPHPGLLDAAAGVGITNVNMDVDGYLRSIRPVWTVDGRSLASFPLAAASQVKGTAPGLSQTDFGFELTLGDRTVPLDRQGVMWVQTGTDPIERYEYLDVLNGTVPPETFRDRIVVVGVAASGASDFHLVPEILGAVEMPGAEFNAKALSTMLFGYVPVRVPPVVSGLFAGLLALIGGLLGSRRPLVAYLGLGATALLWPAAVHLLFVSRVCWMETTWPLAALALAFLTIHALRYVFVHRDWELKTVTVNQIASLDAASVDQFEEFKDFLASIWPQVAGGTGVRLVHGAIPTSELDPRFLARRDGQATVVRPGPDGMLHGIALPIPHAGSEQRHTLLGWNRGVGLETIQALSAVILSNAWFYSNLKDASDRKAMLFRTIRSIFKALDFRDPITGGHSNRVSSLALEIMEKMRLRDLHMVEDVYLGALVHDVGKIGIPDAVLRKEGKLTDDEYTYIKTHPEIGMEIMGSVGLPPETLRTLAEHHERYDGSGYPARLKGEEISLGGRITAVADVFDALTSDRPYRDGWSAKKTCDYIREGRGTAFDPEVVDALLELKQDDLITDTTSATDRTSDS